MVGLVVVVMVNDGDISSKALHEFFVMVVLPLPVPPAIPMTITSSMGYPLYIFLTDHFTIYSALFQFDFYIFLLYNPNYLLGLIT